MRLARINVLYSRQDALLLWFSFVLDWSMSMYAAAQVEMMITKSGGGSSSGKLCRPSKIWEVIADPVLLGFQNMVVSGFHNLVRSISGIFSMAGSGCRFFTNVGSGSSFSSEGRIRASFFSKVGSGPGLIRVKRSRIHNQGSMVGFHCQVMR